MSHLGVISASTDACVTAAEEALRAGGNAVDAAVAAALATAAGDPAITSFAGGGMLAYLPGGEHHVEVCDFFGSTPGLGGRHWDMYGSEDRGARRDLDFHAVAVDFGAGGTSQTFHVGRGAAAVPGFLPGLAAITERWGRLSLEELVSPTIRLLREGVLLTPYQSGCLAVLRPILERSEAGRRLFFDGAGNLLAIGDRFTNAALARTLEQLIEVGFHSWYRDALVPSLLEEFGEHRGGWLTGKDLEEYQPTFKRASVGRFSGATVYTPPGPSLGGRFVQHTLELFERCGVGNAEDGSPEYFFLVTAVLQAVATVRSIDPEILESKAAGRTLRASLDAILSGHRCVTETEPRTPGNTTHINVVDAAGSAAAVTLSHGEGNGHAVGDTGILMNNFLGEEDLFPAGFFRTEPGQPLATMMAPTILQFPDGTVAALGTGGANRIRSMIPQVVARLLDPEGSVGTAVAAPRVHVESDLLSAETFQLGGDNAPLEKARTLVADVRYFERPSLFFGGVHVALRRADGSLEGTADNRRGGACRIVE